MTVSLGRRGGKNPAGEQTAWSASLQKRPQCYAAGETTRWVNNGLIDRNIVTPKHQDRGLLLKTELADPSPDAMFPAALKEGTMAEAQLAPNLPDWMLEHANRYLASGGTDGHMYRVTVPGRGEITVPALLLTTTGRKSGDKFIFPLFYGTDGGSYFIVASKGGAPQHPGWYRNILANPDVEVQVGTKKMNARARTIAGEERLRLWKKALEFWPPYADYQLKTEREIPVVVLDPVH
jgi:deazaflavin-dependent oxidoreductase (nitroreductase family)